MVVEGLGREQMTAKEHLISTLHNMKAARQEMA
jgi:hypothetical protein